MESKRIAIIGCGNLGLSILNGLLDNSIIAPSNIIVTKRNIKSLAYLEEKGIKVSSDNAEAVRTADVIIVALKPYNILEVLKELKDLFNVNQHILISLATGVSLKEIESTIALPLPIFRAMPNTAADVGNSITCIASNTSHVEATETVQYYFNSIGETIIIDENLMDSATVLGACGIAYALRFIRAMIQGGVQIGFDAKTASAIATQTVKGAAELLITRKQHPEHEIDKVTTPKGCTSAGLNEMEHNGFSSALIKGILTSFDEIEK